MTMPSPAPHPVATDSTVHAQAEAIERLVTTFNVPFEALLLACERIAQMRLQSGSEITRQETDALVQIRGLDEAERLSRECGTTWSSEEVARHLGVTRQAVHERKTHGRLLAFGVPSGRGDRYPAWQFRGRYVRSWVPKLIDTLGNGFPAISFLLAPRDSHGGHCFRDVALSGDDESVTQILECAKTHGASRAQVP